MRQTRLFEQIIEGVSKCSTAEVTVALKDSLTETATLEAVLSAYPLTL